MEAGHPALVLSLALLIGVLAQSAARHLRVPGIVLLLAAGLGLGPDGFGWVHPGELGSALYAVVDMAVSVILFEGGLNLQLSRLRRERASIRSLISWGALLTLAGGALAAHELMAWSWRSSLLFGSLVVVTGPTVVGPLVAELRLRPRVATLLEAEGVLIDPIGAILAVLMLEVSLSPDADTLASGGLGLVARLGFGAGAGAICGLLMAWMLRTRRLVPEGHENILALALVLLLYQACEFFVPHSGLPAVTLAGVVVGNFRTLVDRDLREFKDQLSVLLVGLLFVLLAADVRIEQVVALGAAGLGVVLILIFVVRPLVVFLCTLGSDLPWRERVFVAWVAPRGIVAAAFASIVAETLGNGGEGGGIELRSLVFLTIACTVVSAGFGAPLLGRWLGVRLPSREGAVILGANALGLALARALREAETPVTFLDVNPHSCREAEEAGFDVIFGDALKERSMQRAHLESVATAVALTPNEALNAAFVSRAREHYGVPRALVVARDLAGGLLDEMKRRGEVDRVFDGHHDVERWQGRARAGSITYVRAEYAQAESASSSTKAAAKAENLPTENGGEQFVMLAIERAGRAMPMQATFEPRANDLATLAIHTPETEQVLQTLADRGWIVREEAGGAAGSCGNSAD